MQFGKKEKSRGWEKKTAQRMTHKLMTHSTTFCMGLSFGFSKRNKECEERLKDLGGVGGRGNP